MTSQEKYHAAIEVKDIVSFFLRRMNDIRQYVEFGKEECLIEKFNEVEKNCKELFDLAAKVAETERPPERKLMDPDRGINDFLEGVCDWGCDCDGNCGGGCGNCGGGCSP